jgi:hypothetical protein
MSWLTDMVWEAWLVLAQMAPYLLFGFFTAGLLSVAISPEWVERHLGGRGWLPIIKAAALGVPLPLCSCGVIPVTASIRRHGASRGATVGFLLSTPQTGVDSIFATYALLGPVYAIYRPVAALVMGVIGGALADWVDPARRDPDTGMEIDATACADACCSDGPRHGVVRRVFEYGFVTLPRDLALALLGGIAVAAAISVLLPQDTLAPYLGGSISAMLIMVAVGIPIYVCSTASIPIAVGFVHLGVSPGAALAFLISGPATNAAAIAVTWKVLGPRVTSVYLATIAIGALAAGFSLDALFHWLPAAQIALGEHMHMHAGIGWFGHLSAVVLLGVLAYSLCPERAAARTAGVSPMDNTLTLKVNGMTCSHCANAVARALRAVAGVADAHVDLARGEVTISGNTLDASALAEAVHALGYDAAPLPR